VLLIDQPRPSIVNRLPGLALFKNLYYTNSDISSYPRNRGKSDVWLSVWTSRVELSIQNRAKLYAVPFS
jgi:hypothetical protein